MPTIPNSASFDTALQIVRGGPASSAFYTAPTPEELLAVYGAGFRGVRPEKATPEDRRAFADYMAKQPRLYDVFPWAKGIGKGKSAAPYAAMLHFDPKFGGDEAQGTGSCVAHSLINGTSIDYANDALHGEATYKGRLAKSPAYRSRGFNSAGWFCSASVEWVAKGGPGGNLYRKKYEGPNGETVDLSNLKAAERWSMNGRAGCPEWLQQEARKSQVKWTPPINTLEEYRDALFLGFGLTVCSGYGFSRTTDANGLASQRGSWAHAMAHAAYSDSEWANRKYGSLIGMILQSWGAWNSQNGVPEGMPAMPVGAFYALGRVIAAMIRSDAFALCGVWGFDRIGWEAFDTSGDVAKAMQDSTIQDYYKHRSERVSELTERAFDEVDFFTGNAV